MLAFTTCLSAAIFHIDTPLSTSQLRCGLDLFNLKIWTPNKWQYLNWAESCFYGLLGSDVFDQLFRCKKSERHLQRLKEMFLRNFPVSLLSLSLFAVVSQWFWKSVTSANVLQKDCGHHDFAILNLILDQHPCWSLLLSNFKNRQKSYI